MAAPGHPLDGGARGHRNVRPDFRSPPPSTSNAQSLANPNQAPMPVPAGPHRPNGNGYTGTQPRRNGAELHGGGTHGHGFAFRDAPGGTKNTSHVPCKFFRLGNCQAGKACPFSHALDTINDPAPCKYFAKGNCKYGYKCANPHILPDGRDGRKVNQARRPFPQDPTGFNLGPPAQGLPFADQGPSNAYPVMPPTSPHFDPYNPPTDDHFIQQRALGNLPTIDQAYNSRARMQYGSPSGDSNNLNTLSPPVRAMDAQLPASFDTNGISNMARFGPMGSSVPSRFGFGPSSPTTSTATSNAMGNLGHMARGGENESYRATDLGSSPPAVTGYAFPKRILHSDRVSQQAHVASSLPVPRPPMRMHHDGPDSGDDSDDNKVNWLPGALSDDVMTPQEKMRRFSRNIDENSGLSAQGSLTLSGLGSAHESKVGSPSNGSPASRWGALFAQKQRQPDVSNEFHSSSPFGHVGSPLRNSSGPVNPEVSPSIRPIAAPQGGTRSGDASPFGMSSPPSGIRAKTGGGIGILSQQLKNTRLRESSNSTGVAEASSNSSLHPLAGLRSASYLNSANASNNASAAGTAGSTAPLTSTRLDRVVSSSSMGRQSDRIDEKTESDAEVYLFEMDDEDTRVKEALKKEREKQKRWSGSAGGVYQGGSPWNIASVAEPRVSMSSSDGMSSASPPANTSVNATLQPKAIGNRRHEDA